MNSLPDNLQSSDPAEEAERKPFFVTGGTLQGDAASYVVRQADADLYDSLIRGEFCYVLNTRQMGKSSLSVRTLQRLKEAGVRTVFLDLTRFGVQNVAPDQWYASLMAETGRALGMRREFIQYWKDQAAFSPVLRLFGAIEELALADERPLVLLIDEIDAVRSLPFSADEFFAAIRACHNRRTESPRLHRLTFCLIGVATPAELVTDSRLSPFNIGRRIVLSDFTPGEARVLARGLGENGAALLDRVLYWSGGHPYITQRLCQSVAQGKATSPGDVDLICDHLFLSRRAREADDNLTFVRNRLLQSDTDRSALVDRYRQAYAPRGIRDDETDPLCASLRLSGVVRTTAEGRLQVRNRIYRHVFDRAWIIEHLPDAELRRQRDAYRRGLLRALLGSSIVVALLLTLFLVALGNAQVALRERRRADSARSLANENAQQARRSAQQARDAAERSARLVRDREAALKESEKQRDLARRATGRAVQAATQANEAARLRALSEAGAQREKIRADREAVRARGAENVAMAHAASETLARHKAERLSYSSAVREAQRALDQGDLVEARSALNLFADSPLRGWEWRYLAGQSRDDSSQVLRGHSRDVFATVWSPDGTLLASGGRDGVLRLWDAQSGRALLTRALPGAMSANINCLIFTPNGRTLFIGADRVYRLDVASRTLQQEAGSFDSPQFTESVPTPQVLSRFPQAGLADSSNFERRVRSFALSPDGATLAIGCQNGDFLLWDLVGQRRTKLIFTKPLPILALAFSPDGRKIAAGCADYSGMNAVQLWDLAQNRQSGSFTVQAGGGKGWGFINGVAFSPDGTHLAGAGQDDQVHLWELASGNAMTLSGHENAVTAVAYSPDGRMLVSGSADNTIRLWDVSSGNGVHAVGVLRGHTRPIHTLAFSPDGQSLVSGASDTTVRQWRIAPHRTPTWEGHQGIVSNLQYSPDGSLLASGAIHGDNKVRLWEAGTGKLYATIEEHKGGCYLAFAHHANRLAVGGDDGRVTLWQVRPWRRLGELEGVGEAIKALAFSPDDRLLATGGSGGSGRKGFTPRLWDVATRRETAVFPSFTGWVLSVAFSPDGRTVVFGGGEGEMRWYDVATHQERALPGDTRQLGHHDNVFALAFSPDGQFLASGSEDKTVRLWDTETRTVRQTLRQHTDVVWGVAFSPDGRTLASAGKDGTIRFWPLAALSDHLVSNAFTVSSGWYGLPSWRLNGVYAISFSPDGSTVATGDTVGSITLRRVPQP